VGEDDAAATGSELDADQPRAVRGEEPNDAAPLGAHHTGVAHPQRRRSGTSGSSAIRGRRRPYERDE
jgi:hypothetical protein